MGRWPKHPVGINLGKSKTTPLEKAAEDYAASFRVLRPWADFFVVNEQNLHGPHRLEIALRDAQGREIAREAKRVTLTGGEVYGELLASAIELPVDASAMHVGDYDFASNNEFFLSLLHGFLVAAAAGATVLGALVRGSGLGTRWTRGSKD